MSGQLHASAAVPLEALWAFCKREKSLVPACNRSPDYPDRSLVTLRTTLSLPVKKYVVHRLSSSLFDSIRIPVKLLHSQVRMLSLALCSQTPPVCSHLRERNFTPSKTGKFCISIRQFLRCEVLTDLTVKISSRM